jgi:hypothetical protein
VSWWKSPPFWNVRPHAFGRDLVGREVLYRLSGQLDYTRGCAHDSADDVQERRLAGPFGPITATISPGATSSDACDSAAMPAIRRSRPWCGAAAPRS